MTEKEFNKICKEISDIICARTTVKDGEWVTQILLSCVLTFLMVRIDEGEDKADLLNEFMSEQAKIMNWFLNSGDKANNERVSARLKDITTSLIGKVTKH